MHSQKWQNDLCSFPRQTIPTSNAEEAEVERFYEEIQDLSELTPKKDVLFIIRDWNAKVGSQEASGVTGEFGFGVQNEAGQRLIEFCQENALVIAPPSSNNTREASAHRHHQMANTKIRLIIFFTAKALSVQFNSVTQLCPTLCNLMNRSTPGLPIHHQLPESIQTHVHWVGDAIQPSHPLLSPSPPALNLS